MNIFVSSVFVDDQAGALGFYTNTLGFQVKQDVPVADGGCGCVVGVTEAGSPERVLSVDLCRPIFHLLYNGYRQQHGVGNR
ncbi:VOC family protein [Parahaliea mediterranea]|uniref:VOC family protein n=1 Tax=Parahaliea mediterranea TaxID=651086 RepID=UPI003D66F8FD